MQAVKQMAVEKEPTKVARTWGLSSAGKSNSTEPGKGPVKKISPFGKDRNLRQHVELFYPDKVTPSTDSSANQSSSTSKGSKELNVAEREQSSSPIEVTVISGPETAVPLSKMLHQMNADEVTTSSSSTKVTVATGKDPNSSRRSKSTETKGRPSASGTSSTVKGTSSRGSDGRRSKSTETKEKTSTKDKSDRGKDIRSDVRRRSSSTETKEPTKMKAKKAVVVKLDEKLVNVYLTAFLDRQKKSDECLDIDNGRTRTPKFDRHNEAPT